MTRPPQSARSIVLFRGATASALALALGLIGPLRSDGGEGGEPGDLNAGASGNPYGRWEKGPPSDPEFFPIAVWLQHPRNAGLYRAAGINVYVGLWKGPTDEQLDALQKADLAVICHQNEVGLRRREGSTIIGWMHGDEPDNAQSLGDGKGYGPPIASERIVADYRRIRERDPTRPVLLNLGQGVAWDGWHGRGVRTNHPEDYPEYVRGCDIASFDIYPVVHSRPQVAGKLWYVPRGVDRLRSWSEDRKVVWNCIECTRISSLDAKPTPRQVRAEVWMSLIHGSMGLIYFVHQFRPEFIEAGLLADAEMLEGVTAINAEIHRLAPVLNSPSAPELLAVESSSAEVPIDAMVKTGEGSIHVFAVSMREGKTGGTFRLREPGGRRQVEVIGEGRSLPIEDGVFRDQFSDYEVHLYRIPPPAASRTSPQSAHRLPLSPL